MAFKIIGVGGGGGFVLSHLMGMNLGIKDCVLADTCDLRQKNRLDLPLLLLGPNALKGEGAGGSPKHGAMAAEESKGEIERFLEGTDLLVLVAGLSGGTGTGAAPVIARIAREMGVSTVAFVGMPFDFEGPVRARQAREGLESLRDIVDALNVIPNRLALVRRGDCETMDMWEQMAVSNAFIARVVAGYISARRVA